MKSISFLTALILGAVSPSYAQTGSEPSTWGVTEVDAYIQGFQAANKKASDDPFAKPAAAEAPAQRIVFRFPFYQPGVPERRTPPHHSASWEYDAASELLTLRSFAPDDGAELRLDTLGRKDAYRLKMLGIDVYYDSRSKDAGIYQNGYGSRTAVTNLNIETRGIGELRTVINFRDEYVFELKHYTDKRTIAPEMARELTRHLEMEIEATPDEWAPGKWIICGTYNDRPTLESPKRLAKTGCYLTVKYKAFRYIDARTGEVVNEWKSGAGSAYQLNSTTSPLGR